MNAIQVLEAFAEDGKLAEEVLGYLNGGMWDEWDTDLWSGVSQHGFGGDELAVAARSGLILAKHHEKEGEKR